MHVMLRLAVLLLLALAPAAAAAPHEKHAPVVIPFEMSAGGHVTFDIEVNGIKGRAVLDNGALSSVIDKAFAEKNGIARGSQAARNFIRPFFAGYDLGQITTLRLGGVEESVTPILIDLSGLQEDPARPIIAIAGEEMFDRHVVQVDFTAGKITLTDRADFTLPAGYLAAPVRTAFGSAKLFVPVAMEGGKAMLGIIDLGNPGALLVRETAQTQKWKADGRKSVPTQMGVVRGDAMPGISSRTTTAGTVTLAGQSFRDVPVVVGGFDMMLTMEALVGTPILSRFDLVFDTPKGALWIKPRAGADEPFRRRVLGVAWRAPMQPGALEVRDVMPGSPAEKAGLKAGDVVARVNGRQSTAALFAGMKAGDTALLEMAGGKQVSLVAENFY